MKLDSKLFEKSFEIKFTFVICYTFVEVYYKYYLLRQERRRRHYRQEVIIYHEERSDLFNILSSIICSKMRNSLRRLRNPGSSGSEGSVDAGMNGVVGETSVEKPEKFTLNKDLDLCLTIFYLS